MRKLPLGATIYSFCVESLLLTCCFHFHLFDQPEYLDLSLHELVNNKYTCQSNSAIYHSKSKILGSSDPNVSGLMYKTKPAIYIVINNSTQNNDFPKSRQHIYIISYLEDQCLKKVSNDFRNKTVTIIDPAAKLFQAWTKLQ